MREKIIKVISFFCFRMGLNIVTARLLDFRWGSVNGHFLNKK